MILLSKYFVMDPNIVDLLIDGTLLREGMIVLIENDGYRANIDAYTRQPKVFPGGAPEEEVVARARKYNQWMKIEHLQFPESKVRFIGVDEDGHKKLFVENKDEAWYVLKNSIPEDHLPVETNWKLGYTAGVRAGKYQGERNLESAKKEAYNQGFVEGSKYIQQTEAYLLEKPYTTRKYQGPYGGYVSRNSILTDTHVLNDIMNTPVHGRDLKDIALEFKDAGNSAPLIDEALEEEQSGTVIRGLAKPTDEVEG